MFCQSVFRRILPLSSRAFCTPASFNEASEMPDKLYKMVELEIKSAEPAVMKSYETFIEQAAGHLGVKIGKIWQGGRNKYNVKRYTVLKSVFIYKKHMNTFETRTYYKWIQLHKLTGSTADTFLEYIERMLPEGVGLKVTKISLEPMPSHLKPEEVQKS